MEEQAIIDGLPKPKALPILPRLTAGNTRGWYECRCSDGEESRLVVRYWDGKALRYEPDDVICRLDRHSDFRGPLVGGEL